MPAVAVSANVYCSPLKLVSTVIGPVDADAPLGPVLAEPTTTADEFVTLSENESVLKPLTTVLFNSSRETKTPNAKPSSPLPVIDWVNVVGASEARIGVPVLLPTLVPVQVTDVVPTPVNPPPQELPSGPREEIVFDDVQVMCSPLSVDSASAPIRE